jgi:hypothetical protein
VTTLLVFHEVDDVDHWVKSARREEVFGPLGITTRPFIDPTGSNRVGLVVDIPDMAAFQAVMESEAGADAMKLRRRPPGDDAEPRRTLTRSGAAHVPFGT